MIKIELSKDDMEYIEKEHWKWFEAYYNMIFTSIKGSDEERFFYKEYNINTREYERVEINNKEIIRFLRYINQSSSDSEPKVLKTIIVGKLTNEKNKENSIRYVTENILKEFPQIFNEPIKKSVNSFLSSKRKILANLKDNDRNTNSAEINKVKDSMKKYFEINKDIFQVYINDIDNIDSKIEKIKLTNKNISNFSKDKFIEYKYHIDGIFYEAEKVLSSIFNYKDFINEGKDDINCWGAYKLLKKLNINTCPYCNRNYIHTYIDVDGMCRADIDHFYPKSRYPFLAVSLYNFIPSCHTCNSSFKSSVDTFLLPHIYPYEDTFGENVKFKTEPGTGEDKVGYLLGNSDKFKITLDIRDSLIKDKVENSNCTFKIEKLYDFHKDYVQEIIKKAKIYNETRINELLQQYPQLFQDRNEIIRTIFSNYIEDKELSNRPLSKLTKDILEEFNIKI
jgi:hypothetical protein